ncbi:BTAD domain-containing putative transcriptional regulator [Streptomyces sp. MMS24-I2-30]|uniref:AfsR/SARP family transcriptional regulator n=1 Tax=Streptomyces sp. MMS24-I2-30 TaxID=3351564 RepID=UPI003896E10E
MIRVEVLGPFAVRRDGAEVPLGPPQQRALFAALVLARGVPLSATTLAAGIWDGEAPASAVAVIRKYVHHLRRLLGGELTITSSRRGYALTLAPGMLDADDFSRAVHAADRARAAGDLDTAGGRLREALALWRGPALTGVTGPGADQHRPVLDGQHLAALRSRLEIDLELGREQRILPELRSLADAHPLDEHLRLLLMTALYRCGRQAEAIASYQECLKLLRDDLGVDPDPRLRELYGRILHADETPLPTSAVPSVPAQPPTPVVPSVPAQLPAPSAAFVGRAKELERMEALSDGGVVVISGMAGVGKTTLALHGAHRIAERFGDGHLYADLHGFGPGREPTPPGEILDRFLQALGVAPADVPDDLAVRAGLFRTLTTGRRLLILLDNAAGADQVRDLLPGAGPGLVVITSRGTLPTLLARVGARLLALRPPKDEEALALLAARVGTDRTRAEPVAAREIVAGTGGLPLALAVVAARAVAQEHLPLSAIAAELHDAHGTLDAFGGAGDVRAVLSWSYRALEPAAADALRVLGTHPGPDVTVAAAASMLALPERHTRALLRALVEAALLVEHRTGRFAAHDLVRAFASELPWPGDQERREAVHRLLDHHLHTAEQAMAAVFTGRPRIALPPALPGVVVSAPPPNAALWFVDEHPTLLAAHDLAHRDGFDGHSWRLAWALRDFFSRHGLWHHLQTSQHLGLAAARRLGDRLAEAHSRRGLALVESNMGRYSAAREQLREAAGAFEAAGAKEFLAETYRFEIWVLDRAAEHESQLKSAQDLLDLYPLASGARHRAWALNAVSWSQVRLGRFGPALEHAEAALALGDGLGPYSLADTLHTLGSAQAGLGDHEAAQRSFTRSADSYLRLGAHAHAVVALRALGDVHRDAGRRDLADAAYRRALAVAEETDDPRAAAISGELAVYRT